MTIRAYHFVLIVLLIFGYSCNSITGIDDFGNFHSQISDESLNEDTKELFKRNAAALTFRDQNERDPSLLYLSEDLLNSYYDLQVLIATSEVGKQFPLTLNTRVFESINLNELLLTPKKDYPFVPRWYKGIIHTGIMEIDELLKENNFYVRSLLELQNRKMPIYILKRDQPINTLVITQGLSETGYFRTAGTNLLSGPMTNINFERKNDFLSASYQICTGGSITGCTKPEIYTFKVSQDGEVSFEGKSFN